MILLTGECGKMCNPDNYFDFTEEDKEYIETLERKEKDGTISEQGADYLLYIREKWEAKKAIELIPDSHFNFLSELLDGYLVKYNFSHPKEMRVKNQIDERLAFIDRLTTLSKGYQYQTLDIENDPYCLIEVYEIMKDLKIKPKQGVKHG